MNQKAGGRGDIAATQIKRGGRVDLSGAAGALNRGPDETKRAAAGAHGAAVEDVIGDRAVAQDCAADGIRDLADSSSA